MKTGYEEQDLYLQFVFFFGKNIAPICLIPTINQCPTQYKGEVTSLMIACINKVHSLLVSQQAMERTGQGIVCFEKGSKAYIHTPCQY